MRVIIYAAGLSRRLSSIAGHGLKGLLDLNGKRLIEYQLDWIVQLLPNEIVLVLGMEHDLYREFLGSSYKGVSIVYVYNPDYKDKGNMLSLWHARDHCDDKTLFTTSDLLCDYRDISDFVKHPSENKILIDNKSTDLFENPDPVKVTVCNNRVTHILKDRYQMARVDGVAIGLYQFSESGIATVLKSIEEKIQVGNDNLSLYYALDHVLANENVEPVFAEACLWTDIDTPDELESAKGLRISINPI